MFLYIPSGGRPLNTELDGPLNTFNTELDRPLNTELAPPLYSELDRPLNTF